MQYDGGDEADDNRNNFCDFAFIKRKADKHADDRRSDEVNQHGADGAKVAIYYGGGELTFGERLEKKDGVFDGGKAQGGRNQVNGGIDRFVVVFSAQGEKVSQEEFGQFFDDWSEDYYQSKAIEGQVVIIEGIDDIIPKISNQSAVRNGSGKKSRKIVFKKEGDQDGNGSGNESGEQVEPRFGLESVLALPKPKPKECRQNATKQG